MMTDLDSGGQRLKVKVTAGRRVGKGIHVDDAVSKSIFYLEIVLKLFIH